VTDASPRVPAAGVGVAAMPGEVRAAGYVWHTIEWRVADAPHVLLIHGLTSDSGTFWRLGPALAAAGWHVVAVDLPGHGQTRHWRHRHRFVETAADVLAAVAALEVKTHPFSVVAHSWGAMVASALPQAGFVPRAIVLIDPPALTLAELETLSRDPEYRPRAVSAAALDDLRTSNPDWSEGDIRATAEARGRFEGDAVREILLENGPWDAGLANLSDPAASESDAWLIRGEASCGGLIPDAAFEQFRGRLGADRVVTIAGGGHSPHRDRFEATLTAIRGALDPSPT
jgi:pimeloyl-ACP methyl ester carboxylesterase